MASNGYYFDYIHEADFTSEGRTRGGSQPHSTFSTCTTSNFKAVAGQGPAVPTDKPDVARDGVTRHSRGVSRRPRVGPRTLPVGSGWIPTLPWPPCRRESTPTEVRPIAPSVQIQRSGGGPVKEPERTRHKMAHAEGHYGEYPCHSDTKGGQTKQSARTRHGMAEVLRITPVSFDRFPNEFPRNIYSKVSFQGAANRRGTLSSRRSSAGGV